MAKLRFSLPYQSLLPLRDFSFKNTKESDVASETLGNMFTWFPAEKVWLLLISGARLAIGVLSWQNLGAQLIWSCHVMPIGDRKKR